MNHYAVLAQEWWKKNAPLRLAALENPEAYFASLGESAAEQIAMIEDSQRAKLPNDLSYLEQVAQLQAIRKQAEEIVLTELVYSLEVETTMSEELDDLLGNLPSLIDVDAMTAQIHEDATDLAERESWPEVILSDEQAEKLGRLQELRHLLTRGQSPETLSEDAKRDLVLSLRAFWDETNAVTIL